MLSSSAEARLQVKDDEIVKLLADNHDLSEELRQCQADKEFVWTLWKRLQVSSPDLTQAVSLVMQREKEKCEVKDRKILEILHSKDEQIENLQDTVTSLKKEVDKLVQMKSSLEGTRLTLTTENEEVRRNNGLLNERLNKLETLGQSEAIGLKKSLQDLNDQRDELNDKVTKLLIDLQTARMRSQTLEAENDQLMKRNKKLEGNHQEISLKCQKLQGERESLSEEVINLRGNLSHYKEGQDTARRELDSRQQSHQEIRQSYDQLKAHSEEQQSIILKLRSLNSDTQKVLKEQEETYKEEQGKSHRLYSELARKYESLEKSHHKLNKAYNDLKGRLGSQDKASWETEQRRLQDMAAMTRRGNRSLGDIEDLELQLESQHEEIDTLRRRLKEKNLELTEIRREEYRPVRDNRYAEHTFSPIVERASRSNEKPKADLRSRSLSPDSRHINLVNRRLLATEEKLESTKRLLELKKDELKQIKKAHDKRLIRLKEVQSHYRELKETMQEKDMLSPRKAKPKKKTTKRLSGAELRQENSDAVWNELAFYKRENRNLAHDKLSLEEDLDNLRVQAAMDKATVQELSMCLKQEKDDLMTKLRQNLNSNRLSSTPKKRSTSQKDAGPPTSATTLRHLVKNLERKLENSFEDNRLLKKERGQLVKEIRVLKEENRSLKSDITDSQQTNTKLRRDIADWRRRLESAEDKKLQSDLEAKELRKEAELARASSLGGREENNVMRAENSELRSELMELKAELREITSVLKVTEGGRDVQPTYSRITAPSISSSATSTDSVRKHQEFLDKSINDLREVLGKDDAVATSEDEDSDIASLGERIARVARLVPDAKDLRSDDDDTLVDSSDSKPSVIRASARSKASSRYTSNDLAALKQRLSSMQKQCSSLMTERQNALKQINDEKDRNALLESEVKGVQNRLKATKASVQKLHREVEAISREKEEMQRALESVKNSMPEPQKHSDTDYRLLENKMRMANSDANHYLAQMRKLQKENEEKQDAITGLKEKVARLERDISMKRQLIDEQRAKIKSVEQMNQNEQKAATEFEAELRQLSEDVTHKKNYIESLKKQVQAVGRDKARYEQSYNEAKAQLEKRSEQVSIEQARKLEAENLASQLECTVEQQLNMLASKSEQALDKIQSQLSVSQEKNKEYSTCIQILSNQLLDVLSHLRDSIQGHKERARQEMQLTRESDPSMSRAQSIACSILNMSKADFEELMTPVGSKKNEEEQKAYHGKKGDRDWKAKVEEITQETPPFAKSLNRLLWDKIQDAIHLAEEKSRVQYEITAEKT